MNSQTFFSEYKGVAVVIAIIAVLGIILLLSFVFSSKQIIIKEAANPAPIVAGESQTISWSAKNIGRVGIVIFNGSKPQWIAQNVPAGSGKYAWKSPATLDSGVDYRFAIFAYPWRKGNPIVYSTSPVEVIGQKYASCDDYSAEQEWPYLSDVYPNQHKVFISAGAWSGNLGGLSGADAKCQNEAEKNGYSGEYAAFIGTDSTPAADRIAKTGVFVEAAPIGELAGGRTCHRFIATSPQKFLDKTRLSKDLARVELSEDFSRKLANVWYGRRTSSTDTKCLSIPLQGLINAFSGTYTCQNWEIEKRQVYSGTVPDEADLPRCYNSEGKNFLANYYAASAGALDESGALIISADTCDSSHHLICVQK